MDKSTLLPPLAGEGDRTLYERNAIIENDFGLEYQLSQIDTKEDVDECDVDEYLRGLRAELLNPISASKPVKNEKYVDEDLESLRKKLDDL